VLPGGSQILFLELGVIERKLISHDVAAQTDFDSLETQPLRQRERFHLSGLPEIPIGDPDPEPFAASRGK
jgi:hypothetical protein